MVSGGLQKMGPEIQISFNEPAEKKVKEYEDQFTEDLPTIEDIREKYGTVVWCKYIGCKYNQNVKGLQRTSGTILKNSLYSPLSEQEAIWDSLCVRGEIAVDFNEVRTMGAKMKVPSCFVATTQRTGHIDFSRFLQSDGSPLGGNIDSQHVSDDGYGGLDSNNIYGEN